MSNMDINKDLMDKLDSLEDNLSYLAKQLLKQIDKNKNTSQLQEFILGEINELLVEEVN